MIPDVLVYKYPTTVKTDDLNHKKKYVMFQDQVYLHVNKLVFPFLEKWTYCVCFLHIRFCCEIRIHVCFHKSAI